MASLSEVHLVRNANDLPQALDRQMISLSDHPAHRYESRKARRLGAVQREPLEVRHDPFHELSGRPTLVLESAVSPGLPDRATAKVAQQPFQKREVLLVQGQRERGPDLEPGTQGRAASEGHAKASLALRQAGYEPRIELLASIGTRYCSEGRRIVGAIDLRLRRRTSHLSFRISR
jgi:hypothetical protein